MIIDAILGLISNIVGVLLLPLEAFNVVIDIASSIPVVAKFLMFIAYVIPWNNLLPIFFIIGLIMSFRITVSLIKTVWDLLPLP